MPGSMLGSSGQTVAMKTVDTLLKLEFLLGKNGFGVLRGDH